MFRIRFRAFAWIFLLSYASSLTYAAAASIEDLVTAAKLEGTVSFYAPSTLTAAGAKELHVRTRDGDAPRPRKISHLYNPRRMLDW